METTNKKSKPDNGRESLQIFVRASSATQWQPSRPNSRQEGSLCSFSSRKSSGSTTPDNDYSPPPSSESSPPRGSDRMNSSHLTFALEESLGSLNSSSFSVNLEEEEENAHDDDKEGRDNSNETSSTNIISTSPVPITAPLAKDKKPHSSQITFSPGQDQFSSSTSLSLAPVNLGISAPLPSTFNSVQKKSAGPSSPPVSSEATFSPTSSSESISWRRISKPTTEHQVYSISKPRFHFSDVDSDQQQNYLTDETLQCLKGKLIQFQKDYIESLLVPLSLFRLLLSRLPLLSSCNSLPTKFLGIFPVSSSKQFSWMVQSTIFSNMDEIASFHQQAINASYNSSLSLFDLLRLLTTDSFSFLYLKYRANLSDALLLVKSLRLFDLTAKDPEKGSQISIKRFLKAPIQHVKVFLDFLELLRGGKEDQMLKGTAEPYGVAQALAFALQKRDKIPKFMAYSWDIHYRFPPYQRITIQDSFIMKEASFEYLSQCDDLPITSRIMLTDSRIVAAKQINAYSLESIFCTKASDVDVFDFDDRGAELDLLFVIRKSEITHRFRCASREVKESWVKALPFQYKDDQRRLPTPILF